MSPHDLEWHPPGRNPSAHGPLSRRAILAAGGKAAAALTAVSLGLGVGATLAPSRALAIDWSQLFKGRMPDASGVVKLLEGRAYAGGRRLALGDSVPSGAVVAVEEEGRLVIGLMDGGIFTLSGGSKLELLLDRMSQGILNLLAGALLLASPKGSQYLVTGGGVSAFGIKGTVVYREVFTSAGKEARGMEGPYAVPDAASGYFCTCHGAVDFLRPGSSETYHIERAEYHRSYLIHPQHPGLLRKAPMLNHFDEDIRALVALQDEPRHELSWLRH